MCGRKQKGPGGLDRGLLVRMSARSCACHRLHNWRLDADWRLQKQPFRQRV